MFHFTFRKKLLSGFGMMLVFLLIISGVSYVALTSAKNGFRTYRMMTRDTILAGILQSDMLMVHMSAKDFIISGNDKNKEEYLSHLSALKSFIETAKKEVTDSHRAEQISKIDAAHLQYDNSFQKIIEHHDRRSDLQKNIIDVLGFTMEQNLTELLTASERNSDVLAVFNTSYALRHLLIGQISMVKFLETGEKTLANRAKMDLFEMADYLEVLEGGLRDPERLDLVHQTQKDQQTYNLAIEELITLTLEQNEIIANSLYKIGPQIVELVNNVTGSIQEEQDQLGPALDAQNTQSKLFILFSSTLAVLAGIALITVITRSVLAQLGGDPAEIAKIAKSIADGNLAITFRNDQRKNNKGIYASMEMMVSNLRSIWGDINSGITTLTGNSQELLTIAGQMATNSEQATANAGQVATASELMSGNMNTVAASSGQASDNVQLVATASEEITSTINDIAGNTENARVITQEAVIKAQTVSENIKELGKAAENVGKVTETINEISDQTNLLALNATIEAARAGDAGKGFAVVANEIKELAKQTANATQDISHRIEGIQVTTQSTVGEISQIRDVIHKINEIVTLITGTVEEQSVAIREIVRNIAQAADGMFEVNENVVSSSTVAADIAHDIRVVDEAAKIINNDSLEIRSRATELSQLAEKLQMMSTSFNLYKN